MVAGELGDPRVGGAVEGRNGDGGGGSVARGEERAGHGLDACVGDRGSVRGQFGGLGQSPVPPAGQREEEQYIGDRAGQELAQRIVSTGVRRLVREDGLQLRLRQCGECSGGDVHVRAQQPGAERHRSRIVETTQPSNPDGQSGRHQIVVPVRRPESTDRVCCCHGEP
jgi:hypothetical protein